MGGALRRAPGALRQEPDAAAHPARSGPGPRAGRIAGDPQMGPPARRPETRPARPGRTGRLPAQVSGPELLHRPPEERPLFLQQRRRRVCRPRIPLPAEPPGAQGCLVLQPDPPGPAAPPQRQPRPRAGHHQAVDRRAGEGRRRNPRRGRHRAGAVGLRARRGGARRGGHHRPLRGPQRRHPAAPQPVPDRLCLDHQAGPPAKDP